MVTKLTKLLLPCVCVWEGGGAECINEGKELVPGSVEYFFSCVKLCTLCSVSYSLIM